MELIVMSKIWTIPSFILSKLSKKCKWRLYYWSLFWPNFIIWQYEASFSIRPNVTHVEPYYPVEYALSISAAQFAWRVIASFIYRRLDTYHNISIWFMFEPVAVPVITWTNIVLCSLDGPQLIPGPPYASVMSSMFDPEHKYFKFDVLLCAMELAWMVTSVWLYNVLWTEVYERKREIYRLPVYCKREDIVTRAYKSWKDTDGARSSEDTLKIFSFLFWCFVCLFIPYNLHYEKQKCNIQ